MHQKILGLDISSSTIGWACFEYDSSTQDIKLISHDHFKPPSKKKSNSEFSPRLNFAFEMISELVKVLQPDFIVIEDYVRKFSPGRSQAQTIVVLCAFNEVCSLAAYRQTNREVTKIPVTTIRKHLQKFYNIEVKDKDDVLYLVKKNFINFQTKINRGGRIKKETYDEADAAVVALSFILERFYGIKKGKK